MKKITLLLTTIVLVTAISCRSREERNRLAEEKAQAQTEEKASMVKGVGEGLKNTGKKASESLAEGIGELYNGANEGFDKSLVKKDIRVCDSSKEWITVSRTEQQASDTTNKNVSVYLVFEKDCKGKLLLKAYDSGANEVGRSTMEINEKADNAHYVNFAFDARTPVSLIRYFTIEFKEEVKK